MPQPFALKYEFTPEVLFHDALISLRDLVNSMKLITCRNRWNTRENKQYITETTRNHPPYLPAIRYVLENFPAGTRFPASEDFACYRAPGDREACVASTEPSAPEPRRRLKTRNEVPASDTPTPEEEPIDYDQFLLDDTDRVLTRDELRALSLDNLTRLIRGYALTDEKRMLDKKGYEVVLTTERQIAPSFQAIKYLLSGEYDRDQKAIAEGRHLYPHCKGRRPCKQCVPQPPAVPFSEAFVPVLPWNAEGFKDENDRPIPAQELIVERPEELLEEYFRTCNRYQIPYSIEGAAETLDLDPGVMLNYPAARILAPWHDTFRRAITRIIRNMVERTLEGKTNARLTIYLLQHRFRFHELRPWLDPDSDSWLLKGLTVRQIRQLVPDYVAPSDPPPAAPLLPTGLADTSDCHVTPIGRPSPPEPCAVTGASSPSSAESIADTG